MNDERLKRILSGRRKEDLTEILQMVQQEFGYISEEAMIECAKRLKIPESKVYGVATFYTQFHLTPRGRHIISVCRGTACHVRGAERILDALKEYLGIGEGETTPDMEYTLESVACLGCCALSPCMMVDGRVHGKLTPRKAKEVIEDARGH
jgi:NADH-quinone oxidoreductase subunit E